MNFSSGCKRREQAFNDLFTAVFSASGGVDEGFLIGNLVGNLLGNTPAQDLYVFTAEEDGTFVGGIIFSRLAYEADERTVFVLGPVAVANGWQGKGIGSQLIRHGLETLRDAGVDIVLTYGDPNFYSRLGFAPISETFAPAPFTLRHPEGWQGKSLSGAALTPLKGACRCVAAFNNPAFW